MLPDGSFGAPGWLAPNLRSHPSHPSLDGGQRGKEDQEENDIGDDRKGRGQERNGGGNRRIPYQHGAVRSLRGREEVDAQKAGSPNRG
ncbi:hypothetical protein NDU88_003430 [Pleurodeles waltl]|uniref:Uncharacterized protein n=1 Tax=Pleurodeles waltl TaxID=8319 RepID=A0AAV7QBP8_PLEWA|nr:hypothetical protein NDU88_003430 [Pleurodeles waltl]